MSGLLVASEIHEIAELERLEPEWWDLWRRSATATPFQAPAWLLAWWRAFAPGELCAVAVRRYDRLVGLAPFYIARDHDGRRLLPIGIALSDYLDILVDPAEAAEATSAIALQLARTKSPWDVCELPDLPPQASALALTFPRGRLERGHACPVLDLSSPAACAVPRAKRRDLRQARHRAERRGGLRFLGLDSCSPQSAVEALIRLHGLRWRSEGEAGVLSDPRAQALHRMAAPALADAGVLRFALLVIGESVAGVYYGFCHRRRAYAYLTGFDPAFAYESPGTLLLGHAIDQAAGEGASEFDMLRGQERYKYEWGARDRWTWRRRCERAAYARAV